MIRIERLLVCMIVLLPISLTAAEGPAAGTDTPGQESVVNTPKLYCPFDDPKPRMPAEIHSDKRLDRRVTVSAKSKNMRDLFQEIGRQTGVKIVTERELSGERPLLFFRDKPLRDVMTEISNLYGYYWLVKGKRDAWTYELFQDTVHSQKRDQVRDTQESAQVEALLDAIEEASLALKSDAELERFHKTNPRLCSSVDDPGKRELLRMITLMDRPTIRALLNDVGTVQDYTDLWAEMRSAVLKTLNADSGDPAFMPWTADQLKSTAIHFKRWRASIFTPPHFCFYVDLPAKDGRPAERYISEWPHYNEGEPDLLNLPTAPLGRVIGDPLPSEAKITVKQTREQLYKGAILVGDVLEAISRQAKVNVIADYYFQETPLPACSDKPLDELVSELCQRMDYTCQVEKDTLRFRFNKWYLQPLPEEPPAKLQEYWWKKVTDTGGLSLDDLIDIACLPGKQTFWGGFRFIPQAPQARLFPRTARVVKMLGSLEAEACTPEGLPVSKLNEDQFARIADWAGVVGVKETPEGLLRCVIRIETSGEPVNTLKFILILPDGRPRSVALTASLESLDEKKRHKLIEERAAELSSDLVEVAAPKPE